MPELDPALKLQAVANKLVARFQTIPGVTVYDHEHDGFKPPAIMIGVVDLERVPLEEAETEEGKNDWLQTWAVTAYVTLNDRKTSLTAARRLVGQMVTAIDADQTLGGEADEAKLVDAKMGFNDEQSNRRLIVIECEVECLSLVPDLYP